MKSFKEQLEEKFDGITGGEKKHPLKLMKKIKVEKTDDGYYVPLDKDGYWYLDNKGKPKFGAAYFKDEKSAKISLAKFKYSQLHEIVSTGSVGAGVLDPIKADGKAFGLDFFEVDCDKFNNCMKSPKKKFKHWNKLLGRKDIQQYAKENKNSFLIKRAGYDQYLRAR